MFVIKGVLMELPPIGKKMNAVEVKDLTKTFGSVFANNGISLDVRQGEVLALLGENGSGKSTLVNMLSGIYAPEKGQIYINGKPENFTCPQDAILAGVGMVHQHFKLVDVMTAYENITLGEKNGGFFINKSAIKSRIQKLQEQYGFNIDLDRKINSMSVSEKQTVEIIKMLYRGARILILDEPTAVLTPQETEILFRILRTMKEKGCSIIIITHKLNEVMSISDRVTVLRKGRLAGTVVTKEASEKILASLMIGDKVSLDLERVECEKTKEPLLSVENVTLADKNGIEKLHDISFGIYGGELLGVAGIVGSGQKELCEVITGLQKAVSGKILFDGKDLCTLNTMEIKKLGVRMNFVPEDRLGMGLVAGLGMTENVMLRSYDKEKGFFINRKKGNRKAEEIITRYDIVTPSIHNPVRQLSGGNIQKVLLGRELEMSPKVLVASYPFRGLDVGATNNIIAMLNEQKKKGVAILLVAEDLDQLTAICDRIMVLHDGKIMGMENPENISKEQIGLLMMGKKI